MKKICTILCLLTFSGGIKLYSQQLTGENLSIINGAGLNKIEVDHSSIPLANAFVVEGEGLVKATGLEILSITKGTLFPKRVVNFKVTSAGNVYARQIEVLGSGNFPDYVFKKDYKLRSLGDVERFIDENQHLPEVPSAAEVDQKGFNLGTMNEILLKKIEELTLYLIEQDKKLKNQQLEINNLKKALPLGKF
jgi:hypothetical protein